MELKKYVMGYGKYKGKTLQEVFEKDSFHLFYAFYDNNYDDELFDSAH